MQRVQTTLLAFLLLLAVTGCTPLSKTTLSSLTPLPTMPQTESLTTAPAEGFQRPLTDYASVSALSLSSRRKIDLSTLGLWPSALNGQELAIIHFESLQISIIDMGNNEVTQILQGGKPKWEVVLSDRYLAWIAYEGDLFLPIDGQDQRVATHHIYLYDRASGRQKRITAEPAARMQLVLDGERLVWADKRNEMDDFYTHYDIYGYDLETEQEIPISVAPGAQRWPQLHGDLLVWQDNRHTPSLGTPLSGCDNCPDNRADIYLYDFQSATSRALVEDSKLKSSPTIYGRQVAWVGYSDTNQGDIYLLDLDHEEIQQITDTPDPERLPRLAPGHILWTVSGDCDVIRLDADTGREIHFAYGVYLRELNGDQLRRLSDFKEARMLLDGDTAVITEGCMTGYESYALDLRMVKN